MSNGTVKFAGDGKIEIIDGTSGTPLSLEIPFTNGDFTAGPLNRSMREAVRQVVRNVLIGVRDGAPVEPTLSFTANYKLLTDATNGTVLDMINAKAGTPFAAAVNTAPASIERSTRDIRLTIEDGATDLTLTFHGVHIDLNLSESDTMNTLSFEGQIYGDGTNYVSGDQTYPVPS